MATSTGTKRRDGPWVCSVCGAKAVRLSSAPIQMGFRDGEYAVAGFTYEHCDACGESVLEASQLDAIQRAGVDLARADLGRLSSSDILQLRHDLTLTQAELEAQLGVGTGTVGRWERGTVLQGQRPIGSCESCGRTPSCSRTSASSLARAGARIGSERSGRATGKSFVHLRAGWGWLQNRLNAIFRTRAPLASETHEGAACARSEVLTTISITRRGWRAKDAWQRHDGCTGTSARGAGTCGTSLNVSVDFRRTASTSRNRIATEPGHGSTSTVRSWTADAST